MRIKSSYAYALGYNDAKTLQPKKKGFASGMEARLYNDGYTDFQKGLQPRR